LWARASRLGCWDRRAVGAPGRAVGSRGWCCRPERRAAGAPIPALLGKSKGKGAAGKKGTFPWRRRRAGEGGIGAAAG
jgi:hypothetical protein